METLDRFIAACVTGEPRKAVSFPGFCALYGNWPDAFRRIVELGTVHRKLRRGFSDTWRRAPTYMFRGVRRGRRLVLSRAARPIAVIRRDHQQCCIATGRRRPDRYILGAAATHIAKKFALYSWNNVNPITLKRIASLARIASFYALWRPWRSFAPRCKINQWKFKRG